MRPDHKDAPQVTITLLRYRPKRLFAPSRILSRYEPNPGGKITPRPKGVRVCDRGGNGARFHLFDRRRGRVLLLAADHPSRRAHERRTGSFQMAGRENRNETRTPSKSESVSCAGQVSKYHGAPDPLCGLILRHRNDCAGKRAIGLPQLIQNRKVIGVGNWYQVS